MVINPIVGAYLPIIRIPYWRWGRPSFRPWHLMILPTGCRYHRVDRMPECAWKRCGKMCGGMNRVWTMIWWHVLSNDFRYTCFCKKLPEPELNPHWPPGCKVVFWIWLVKIQSSKFQISFYIVARRQMFRLARQGFWPIFRTSGASTRKSLPPPFFEVGS